MRVELKPEEYNFKPITIQITLECENEIKELYARLKTNRNMSPLEYVNSLKLGVVFQEDCFELCELLEEFIK